jgi:hypothetical protein
VPQQLRLAFSRVSPLYCSSCPCLPPGSTIWNIEVFGAYCDQPLHVQFKLVDYEPLTKRSLSDNSPAAKRFP